MKALQELVKLSDKKVVNSILQGNNQIAGTATITRKFYGLLHGGETDETKIVKVLYGEEATPSLPRYRTMKVRLKKILTAAFSQGRATESSFKNYEEAYKFGFRNLNTSRELILSAAYNAARELLTRTWVAVKEYEIIPLNFGVTDLLASLYLGLSYNEELFSRYNELSEYYATAAAETFKVHQSYKLIRNAIYAQRLSPIEVGKFAAKHVERCRPIKDKYTKSSRVQGDFAVMQITALTEQGLYKQAIEAATIGMNSLGQCKGTSHQMLSMMAIVRVECTIRSEDFKLGQQQIELARSVVKKSHINQIKLLEYAVLLGLRTGEYDFAYSELSKVSHRKLTRYLKQSHIEYWLILEAYVNFLVMAGQIKVDTEKPKLRRFRVTSFINDVPAYSRIKKGMNIQILILQVLFLILLRKFDDAIDRTDALSTYCSRYLRDDENLRNNCFFKLLVITIQENFIRAAIQRKAHKTFQRMLTTREELSVNDTEIIPFETLWEILLKNLPSSPSRAHPKKRTKE